MNTVTRSKNNQKTKNLFFEIDKITFENEFLENYIDQIDFILMTLTNFLIDSGNIQSINSCILDIKFYKYIKIKQLKYAVKDRIKNDIYWEENLYEIFSHLGAKFNKLCNILQSK